MKPHVVGRWHAQGLDAPRFATGAEVVAHLGAVQSQLHDMALWAVGRRCGRTLAELQAEIDAGAFVRTHVLRLTWHFVLLDDLYGLQALTADRVHRLDAPQRVQHGIDDPLLADARAATPTVLADGPLTRAELGAALSSVGVDVAGPRMTHVAMHLEIECLVASGPMRGKQHTYRLIPPPPPQPDRDTLLARAARTYGRGHGPFRARDLAWWTSLTLTEARRAVDLADLAIVEIDGDTYAVPDDPQVDVEPARATLLSNFDEYISYVRDPADFSATTDTLEEIMRGTGLVLVDGRLAGRWQRTVRSSTVDIEVHGLSAPTAAVRSALDAEAQAFGTFLGREARLVVVP